MSDKNPDKGYIAILGWSLNAIDAIDRFDRRYVIVAPDWAQSYAEENDIPFIPWNFERLNERSMEIADLLYGITMGPDAVTKVVSERLRESRPSATLEARASDAPTEAVLETVAATD